MILEMSIAGAVLIAGIALLRQAAFSRVPKRVLSALWFVAIVRLLLPIPDFISRYIGQITLPVAINHHANTTAPPLEIMREYWPLTVPTSNIPTVQISTPEPIWQPNWLLIWAIGAVIVAGYFVFTHWRARRNYATALPLDNPYINDFVGRQGLRRQIQIKQLDTIGSPITYGLIKPIIVLSKTTDLSNWEQLRFVLAHELAHIKRFDVIFKALLALTLAVHWFNPFVWLLFVLANRDIELSCDEAVIRHFGATAKSNYALTLIDLEEKRSLLPVPSLGFATHPLEKRIRYIMKPNQNKKTATIIAVSLITALNLGTLAFASHASNSTTPDAPAPTGTVDGPTLTADHGENKRQLDTVPGSEDDWEAGRLTRDEITALNEQGIYPELKGIPAPLLEFDRDNAIDLGNGQFMMPGSPIVPIDPLPGSSDADRATGWGTSIPIPDDFDRENTTYLGDGEWVRPGWVILGD